MAQLEPGVLLVEREDYAHGPPLGPDLIVEHKVKQQNLQNQGFFF